MLLSWRAAALASVLLACSAHAQTAGSDLFQFTWDALGGVFEGPEITYDRSPICASSNGGVGYPTHQYQEVQLDTLDRNNPTNGGQGVPPPPPVPMPFTGCSAGNLSASAPVTITDTGVVLLAGTAHATATAAMISATAAVQSVDPGSAAHVGTDVRYYRENLSAPPGSTFVLRCTATYNPSGVSGRISVSVRVYTGDPAAPQVGTFDSDPTAPSAPCQTTPVTIGSTGTYAILVELYAAQDDIGSSSGSVSLPNVVALGDSYASGAGDKPYGPSTGDTTCRRSEDGFVTRANLPLSLVFPACAGAQTDNLYTTYQGEPAQLNSLTGQTNLATIMIGGNDSGVLGIAQACALGPVLQAAGVFPRFHQWAAMPPTGSGSRRAAVRPVVRRRPFTNRQSRKQTG